MAGGFAKDGAVQEQIDATIEDAVKRARSEIPKGESLTHCEECDAEIPEARREAVPGVRVSALEVESSGVHLHALEVGTKPAVVSALSTAP